ncbi:MAG: metal-dependent transcriptional regulator [Chitinophagales bacterium]
MLTPSLEDYLEEIYRFSMETGQVKATSLAVSLNVSLPSVTKALRRLGGAGYVDYRAYEEVTLTAKGFSVGNYLVRRNRTLKEFLKLLRIECDIAEEVESMEHYISPSVVMGIDRLIRFANGAETLAAFDRFLMSEGRMEVPPPHIAELDRVKQMRRFGGKVRQPRRANRSPTPPPLSQAKDTD